MTYWRTPRNDPYLRYYCRAWACFTASLFLAAIAVLAWGFS